MNPGNGGLWRCLVYLSVLLMTACSSVLERSDGPPAGDFNASAVADAVPRSEPRSRYGNPESYVVFGRRYHTLKSADGFVERGIASWYGKKFHGKRTSSGETYDMYAMTAAHKQLPLPSYVEVRNVKNGKKVVVRVNDRGPFHDNRIIDLSYTAASKLGIVAMGTGMVELRAVSSPQELSQPPSRPQTVAQSPGRAWLQIGAFRERANAERLMTRLRQVLGDQVRMTPVIIADHPVFRVQVGPVLTVQASDKMVAKLASLGLHNHHYVFE